MKGLEAQPDAVVCDLDGVVYRGGCAIDGAADAIRRLQERGVRTIFATNYSARTPAEYVARLSTMGIQTSEHNVITSSVVVARELRRRFRQNPRALVIGKEGLRNPLLDAGIHVQSSRSCHNVDVVVVGYDDGVTYEDLQKAHREITDGALFVATNQDPTLPTSEGTALATGAILASLTTASGIAPEVMGKPNKPMWREVKECLGYTSRVVVVGDSPDVDLVGHADEGWQTVLVLSGVTDVAAARGLSNPPGLVLPTIAELPERLGELF